MSAPAVVLAQGMMALPIVLPLLFAAVFFAVLLVLLLVKLVFRFVNAYQGRVMLKAPGTRTIVLSSGVAAALVCVYVLYVLATVPLIN